MRVLVLGATGMAGHTISLYFKESGHDVTAFTRREFRYCNNIIGDITRFDILERVISEGDYDAVINAVGLLNKNAEDYKSSAVLHNSYLPHYLSEKTKNIRTKIIHLSTDCVFSGKTGQYSEASIKDGVTFYDRSKALGELENEKDITFRNSIIGPDMDRNGIGLLNWFIQQLGQINGYTNAIWTGVTTLTLAKAIEQAISQDLSGLYHLVNNTSISKFELLTLFNQYLKTEKISIIADNSFCVDKSLVNSRRDFCFKVPSYEEMIIETKEWIKNHVKLYPHYM